MEQNERGLAEQEPRSEQAAGARAREEGRMSVEGAAPARAAAQRAAPTRAAEEEERSLARKCARAVRGMASR
jgi:hypothetical protein